VTRAPTSSDRVAALAAAAALLASGCAPGATDLGLTPACDDQGHPAPSVVLMAQAVPTAPVLPCIRLMPIGWSLGNLEISKGRARFTLNSDRDGLDAVTVVLSETCDLRGATRVPSDHIGLERYERVTRVTGGYGGSRYHRASGGCVTYQFNLRGASRAAPVSEASSALGFVKRDAVRARVLRDTEGRLPLDPPAGEG
jgi:hypothetical protein